LRRDEKTMNTRSPARAICAALLSTVLAQASEIQAQHDARPVSLHQAVNLAQQLDPWLQGSLLRQEALEAQATSAGTLPDPQLSMGFANLPIDSFDFNQEAMTQFKVGVSQQFSRGESLQLQRQQLEKLGAQHPYLRADRKARTRVTVSGLWLDAYQARETIRLIEQDRALFEYLVDVAQSKYGSALGKTRQQDVIRAQLELTRLQDRLAMLHQLYETNQGMLGEWLGPAMQSSGQPDWAQATRHENLQLSTNLPQLQLLEESWLLTAGPLTDSRAAVVLLSHPAILGLEQKIGAEESGIAIAEEKFKPQWGVNASYGYRDDDPMGHARDDFFSVGVTFDLPLFTSNRQDKELQSATARAAATRTEKWLALRNMKAALDARRAVLLRLRERQSLYQDQLLAQMAAQAEASLNAYTNDDGDFSEVVRARIAELNARIDALEIETEIIRTTAQINYFLAGTDSYATNTAGENP
jgi:outer membrane protein TolC